jgi:hypothetical protein
LETLTLISIIVTGASTVVCVIQLTLSLIQMNKDKKENRQYDVTPFCWTTSCSYLKGLFPIL